MWSFWLIAAGIFFILEIFTTGFLIFWLGVGSLISLILSFFISSILIQAAVFVVTSISLIVLTRPLLDKFLKAKGNNSTVTNIYSIIGKKGVVIEDINDINYTGKVKVAGELWSATSSKDLEKGTRIEVTEVNGVKLKVEPIEELSELH